MLTALQWQRLLKKKRSEMWRKVGRVLLVLVIWGAIAAYITCSAMLTQRHKSEQSVERVEIEIVDSASSGQLITSQRVKEMLIERGIATINTNVDKVDTRAIKDMICNEGFVDDVDIYASYSGTLHIRISQRTPLMRLLVDGYDCYITADGYLFRSPAHAALYVPVVSGNYRPQFKPDFEGDLSAVLAGIRANAADSLRMVAAEREAVARRQSHWLKRRKEVRDSTITDRRERQRINDYIAGHLRDCNRDFERLAAKRDAIGKRLERREARYADFRSLISFVERLQRDKFLRAEVVQIVATTTSNGALSLTLIPRSGDHRIEFGWIESVEDKLHRLRLFYDQVAVTSGWESYKSVNLNYADRIVCTYNTEKQ